MTSLPLTGTDLYNLVTQLLLGFKMDQVIFYQLLGLAQGEVEQERPWMILRGEDETQIANPVNNTIANSLYLTPFNLSTDFLNFYSPTRAIVLVASDGITFQWYSEIPKERKHEFKDDNSRFYIDYANNKLYLCGTLDRQYTIHQFYVSNSVAIDGATPWIFPAQFHMILAFKVAANYREMFDYDVVNVQQAETINRGADKIFKSMTEWDALLQESAIAGVDYPDVSGSVGFRSQVVGDNYNNY